jgi:F0F1-type ATP synthase assembly protein I
MQNRKNPLSGSSAGSLWVRYSGLGLELGAAIIGLTLAGFWLDHEFGTGKTWTVVGAVIGVVGGMYNFTRQALQLMNEQRDEEGRDAESDDDTGRD